MNYCVLVVISLLSLDVCSLFFVTWRRSNLLLINTVRKKNYWFFWLCFDLFLFAAWKLWFQQAAKTSRQLVTGENNTHFDIHVLLLRQRMQNSFNGKHSIHSLTVWSCINSTALCWALVAPPPTLLLISRSSLIITLARLFLSLQALLPRGWPFPGWPSAQRVCVIYETQRPAAPAALALLAAVSSLLRQEQGSQHLPPRHSLPVLHGQSQPYSVYVRLYIVNAHAEGVITLNTILSQYWDIWVSFFNSFLWVCFFNKVMKSALHTTHSNIRVSFHVSLRLCTVNPHIVSFLSVTSLFFVSSIL